MVYQTTKPAPNDDLDVSVTDIQQNFLTANTVIDIDHYPFDNLTANKGYHKDIHQPAVSTWTQAGRTAAPALTPLAGINQIIAMNVTPVSTVTSTDTQLFAMTGNSNGTNAGVSQMTGSLVNGTEGYVWCAGILIQWGFYAVSLNATGNIVFKDRVAGAIAFPNSCFNVWTSPTFSTAYPFVIGTTPTSQATISINRSVTGFSPTHFSWSSVTSSGTYDGFFWAAIGN